MYKVLLKDKDNKIFEADIVRYFKYNYDYFLIYTLGEKDEKDYDILYLVEIMEELGEIISQNIKDENQWKGMQSIVKTVIKEIKRDNEKSFEDIDYKEIEKIKIVDPKFFKMENKLVNILASNYLRNDEMIEEFVEEEIEEIEFEIFEPIDSLEDNLVIEPVPNEIEEEIMHTEEDIKVLEPIESNDKLDYKLLYYALKEEKDATDELLDILTDELERYKQKYGELE